jgi:hypothetical protein
MNWLSSFSAFPDLASGPGDRFSGYPPRPYDLKERGFFFSLPAFTYCSREKTPEATLPDLPGRGVPPVRGTADTDSRSHSDL